MPGGQAARWACAAAIWVALAISSAAATEPTSVIVVDFQGVVRNSAAAQDIQQQIDALRQGYQEEFGAIEEELRALEAELTEERGSVASEDFVERRRDFEQRVTDAQREAQARRAELDEALNAAMDRIRDELVEVVAEIAEEEGAGVVLNRSQVILFDQALEFSEEALARLDRTLPRVEVDAPEAP